MRMRGFVAAFAVLCGCGESVPVASPVGRIEAAVVGSQDKIVHDVPAHGAQFDASLAANASGEVLVGVYADPRGWAVHSSVGVTRSSDGGTTWHAPVSTGPKGLAVLLPGSGTCTGSPHVAYDEAGDRFVVATPYYGGGKKGVAVYVSNDGATAGTQWDGPVVAYATDWADVREFTPKVDVHRVSGRLLLSLGERTDTAARVLSTFSDDGGKTWSSAAVVGGGPADRVPEPRYLQNAGGQWAYIVYAYEGPAGHNVACARSTDGGATWEPPVDLDASSFPDTDLAPGVGTPRMAPSMATDASSGRVFVVYQRNDASGTGDIALRTFIGACKPGPALLLNSNPGSDRAQLAPAVARDAKTGMLHATWYDLGAAQTGDLMEVLHVASKDDGATWSAPTPVLDRPFRADFGAIRGWYTIPWTNLGQRIGSVAMDGKLHTLVAATSVEPHYGEDDTPDVYHDLRVDTEVVAPLRIASVSVTETGCADAGNGHLDAGESASIAVTLTSYAKASPTITGISGTLVASGSGVTVGATAVTWPDLEPLDSGSGKTAFDVTLAPTWPAGMPIDLTLHVTTNQGTTELQVRLAIGTPAAGKTLIDETFESVLPPALPAGWTSNVLVAEDVPLDTPWKTASGFSPSTVAFHDDDDAQAQQPELDSPLVTVPASAGTMDLLLDFDLAYRLQDDPPRVLRAIDGLNVLLASEEAYDFVPVEAFATEIRTGTAAGAPKRTPLGAAWSGDSGGVVHVAMRFPGAGMEGAKLRVVFLFEESEPGTCVDAGYAPPCGIAIDNVLLRQVPYVSSPCEQCGNSTLNDGEACDEGAANGTATACCSKTCTPIACDDEDVCTADTCAAGSGCKHAPVANGTSCADADACNGAERCIAGKCTAGVAPSCDDANGCTTDSCDSKSGCLHAGLEDGTPCDDATICNGKESCHDGACQPGTALDCDDQDVCTADSCDPVSGCQNTGLAEGSSCSDGDACNGQETCQVGVCVAGVAPECDDQNPCTSNSCDPAQGCLGMLVPSGTPCPDADACNGAETCQGIACVAGKAPDCNDKDACTTDSCDAATGCKHVALADGASCGDGNACNGDEVCGGGACKPGTALVCKDDDPCTKDGCGKASGCQFTPASNGSSCSDGDACNGLEVCQLGVCKAGKSPDCDDKNGCTTDSCDTSLGCKHVPVADGASCADDNVCNGNETCKAGTCKGTKLDCDDKNPCSVDTCDAELGCQHAAAPEGTACGAGNACNGDEVCQGDACGAGDAPDCDDKNPCTTDTCDQAKGCQHAAAADGLACSDGDLCNGDEACLAGACAAGTALDCDDQDACTTDSCDPVQGCLHSGSCEDTGTAGEDVGGTEADAGPPPPPPSGGSGSSSCQASEHGDGGGAAALGAVALVIALTFRRRKVKILAQDPFAGVSSAP